jgi:hypothetical protein
MQIPCNVTTLWKTLTTFWILENKILKYIKLVNLFVVQISGSITDEHCFFNVNIYENKTMQSINHEFGACHLHVQP